MGMAIKAVNSFLAGRRVLYAAPTSDQIDRFWTEVIRALNPAIEAKVFSKNETKHIVELAGTEQRIRAKTAWNAASLRGDYADELILDEYQLMDETAWGEVGAPMLLDNNGNATFIYTPPSLHSRSTTKARDPQHAAKLYKKAKQNANGRWAVYHFTSRDNPYISADALDEIAQDMTALAYRQEILAQDIDEAPGALWTRKNLDDNRVTKHPDLERVVVAVDPSASSTGDETGIITAGKNESEMYVLADDSVQGSPLEWASAAIVAYYKYDADIIIAEKNQGGEMITQTLAQVDSSVPVKLVHASRGKIVRAEPVAAAYEKNKCHHVGAFHKLEDELCLWMQGNASPNRLDALVWAGTELVVGKSRKLKASSIDLHAPIAPQKTQINTRRKNEVEKLLEAYENG